MTSTQFPHHRLDLAKEAIVNAAVKLVPKHGYDAAFSFLIDAEVPLDVIKRVLNGGPMRARPSPAFTAS